MTVTAFCVHPFRSPLDHWRKDEDPIGWWNAKRKMFAHKLTTSGKISDRASVVSPSEQRGNWKTVRCGELKEALNKNSPLGKSYKKALTAHRMCTHFPDVRYVRGEVFKQARAAGGDIMISEALETDTKMTVNALKSHLSEEVGVMTTTEEAIWSKFVDENINKFNETKDLILSVDNPLEEVGEAALKKSMTGSRAGIIKKIGFSVAKFAWKATKTVAKFIKWLISFIYNSPRTAIAMSIFARVFMLGVCNMIRNNETYKYYNIQAFICHGKVPEKLKTQKVGEKTLEQVDEKTFKKTVEATGEENVYKLPEEVPASTKEEVEELVAKKMMKDIKEMATVKAASMAYEPLANIIKAGSGGIIVYVTAGYGEPIRAVLDALIDLIVDGAKAVTPTIIEWIAVDMGIQFFMDMLNDFVSGRCMGCTGEITKTSLQTERATARAKNEAMFGGVRKHMDVAVMGLWTLAKENRVILGPNSTEKEQSAQEASVAKAIKAIMISRDDLASKGVSMTDMAAFELAASLVLNLLESNEDTNIGPYLVPAVLVAYVVESVLTVADITVNSAKIAKAYLGWGVNYFKLLPKPKMKAIYEYWHAFVADPEGYDAATGSASHPSEVPRVLQGGTGGSW